MSKDQEPHGAACFSRLVHAVSICREGCKPPQTASLRLRGANPLLKTPNESKCARSRIRQACIGPNHHNTKSFFCFFFFAYLCAYVAPETLVQVSSFRSVEKERLKENVSARRSACVDGVSGISNVLRTQRDWSVVNSNRQESEMSSSVKWNE